MMVAGGQMRAHRRSASGRRSAGGVLGRGSGGVSSRIETWVIVQDAIALANEMLRASGAPGSIVLVTDGLPPDQLSALEAQRKSGGAPVHLLAVAGGEDAFVPPRSPPAPALDRNALERAASVAGGSLTVVSADDRDVERLAGQVATSFASVSTGGERWRDAGYWLLPLLLLASLFWFRPGWRIADG